MQGSYSMKYKNHSLKADNQLRKKILIFHVFRTLRLFPKSSDAKSSYLPERKQRDFFLQFLVILNKHIRLVSSLSFLLHPIILQLYVSSVLRSSPEAQPVSTAHYEVTSMVVHVPGYTDLYYYYQCYLQE